MIKFKKVLILMVTLAMLLTVFIQPSPVGAFVSDSQICADLALLIGDGAGVTEEYLEKTSTRLQAAIISLRLTGREASALAFNGTDTATFTDASEVTWEGGKNILAYLKENPQLGWIGNPDGSFKPNDNINAQEIYKVLLESLGYKQGVDFTWDQVINFADSKGFSKALSASPFKNTNLASSLVEALKIVPKGLTIQLVQKLVNTIVIKYADAATAGFSIKPPVKYKYILSVGDYYSFPENTEIQKMLEDKFYIDIALDNYGNDDKTHFSLALASNSMPDLMGSSGWMDSRFNLDACAQISIASLKQNMPNYWNRLLTFTGGEDAAVKLLESSKCSSDGRIISLPTVWSGGAIPYGGAFRADIIESLGLQVPKTIDQLGNILAKYKEKYPKQYPLTCQFKSAAFQAFTTIFGAYGVQIGVWQLFNGKATYYLDLPNMKKAVAKLQDWYKKGYINPEWIVTDDATDIALFKSGEVILRDWSGWWSVDESNPNGLAADIKKSNPNAKIVWANLLTSEAGISPTWGPTWDLFYGETRFSKKLEKDPEKFARLMQIIDTIDYDKNLSITVRYGIEGLHWNYVNGIVTPLQEYSQATPEGMAKAVAYGFCTYPMISAKLDLELVSTYTTSKTYFEELDKYKKFIGWDVQSYIKKFINPFPNPLYDSNGQYLTAQYPNLNTIGTEWVKFVTGESSMDQWDAYVKKYNDAGGSVITKAMNDTYLDAFKDRYK